jgi:glycosidase
MRQHRKRPKFSVELFQENGSIAQRQFGARLRNVYSFRQDNPDIYAYTRELEGRKLLVLLNFSSKKATVKTDYSLSKAKILIGNYQNLPCPKHYSPMKLSS